MEIATNIEPQVVPDSSKLHTSYRTSNSKSSISAPLWLDRLTSCFVLCGLFIFPIAFGGIHPSVYLPYQVLGFLTLGCWILKSPATFRTTFPHYSVAKGALTLLLCFGSYVIFHGLLLYLRSTPHPVIGSSTLLLNPAMYWSSLSTFAFFVCSFVLLTVWLSLRKGRTDKLLSYIIFSGTVVALIALSHWFYDRGKLFWIFEPENIFESDRARWPFVNANHLAHFLIPTFFLALCFIIYKLETVSDQVKQKVSHRLFDERKGIKNLITSTAFQFKVFSIVILIIALLSCGLAIAGSLSRGGWLGCGIGLLLFVLFERKFLGRTHDQAILDNQKLQSFSEISTQKARRKRRQIKRAISFGQVISTLNRLLKPLLIVVTLVILYAFLAGRGGELIEKRIAYGLSYSKDDLRWQFYSDTMPLIQDNLLFGVGLGNWLSNLPAYVSPDIAGLNPEYLHSDPLQLLAETGLVGSGILFTLTLYVVIRLLKSLQSQDQRSKAISFALLLGFTGVIAASFLDFPFHIPAISFAISAQLALLVTLIGSTSAESNSR